MKIYEFSLSSSDHRRRKTHSSELTFVMRTVNNLTNELAKPHWKFSCTNVTACTHSGTLYEVTASYQGGDKVLMTNLSI